MATRDLMPSAQARVRPEIEAHYAEAVASHLKDGLPEPAAQAAALADLGDAQVAARRFQKEHLTIRDTLRVTFLAIGQICMGLVWISGYVINSFHPDPLDLSDALLFLLTFFFIFIAIAVLVWRKPKVVNRRLLVSLASLAWLNAGLFSLENYISLPSGAFTFVLAMCYIFVAAYASLFFLLLRKKLVSANEGDPPPRNPTTA
jgi:hypothetical protein